VIRQPRPTADLAQAVDDLGEHGYCLVAQALAETEVSALRSQIMTVAAEERRLDVATLEYDGANQRIWQLLNRGPGFADLVTHDKVLAVVDHLLGEHTAWNRPADGLPQFLLSNLTANIVGTGGTAMHLHADQSYVPFPWPDFPLAVNVVWMLDEFTSANGATRVVPRSHLALGHPGQAAKAVAVEASAGTALVLDGRTWHGTGRNTTSRSRVGVLAYYCKPWIRQQENQLLSVDPTVARAASRPLRRLLGYDPFGNLGQVNGRPVDLGTGAE
jgi:ectoine hydroxylase-related dioxygenase (phytanoyl-CoA dioxygenase family)